MSKNNPDSFFPIDRFLEVDRETFTLTLWKRKEGKMRFEHTNIYPISVGKVGYATTPGLYLIHGRSTKPDWKMPHSDWVPVELRGQVLKFDDPNNPIKARWLGVWDGFGLHGTEDVESIGKPASHGCLRMKIDDIIALYPQVPKFTPIRVMR